MLRTLRFLLCIVIVTSAGCASYVSHSVKIRSSLAEGNFDRALDEVAKAENGSSRLLTLYERGLILHYAGKYAESNLQLHEAEALYDDLYTKSVSREAGALLTSDVVTDYRGERFESAYIHYYKILNFLHLEDGQGALVECRKLNQKLKVFHDAGGTFYTDDPFLEYLTGMVYESGGEMSDAWVSYRVAMEAYAGLAGDFHVPEPPTLYCDTERAALSLGQTSDAPVDAARGPCPNPDPGSGTVVLLLETGFAPQKTQIDLFAPILETDFKDEDFDEDRFAWTLADRARPRREYSGKVAHWLRIAFPEIGGEPPLAAEIEVVPVEVPAAAVRAAPGADLDVLALKRFDEIRTRIMVKTLARALAKYLAKESVEKKSGQLAGLAVNIFNVATETADTRSWSTLPGRIYLARIPLPEGTYTLQVVLRKPSGERLETIPIPGVKVSPGRITFLNHRVF